MWLATLPIQDVIKLNQLWEKILTTPDDDPEQIEDCLIKIFIYMLDFNDGTAAVPLIVDGARRDTHYQNYSADMILKNVSHNGSRVQQTLPYLRYLSRGGQLL